MNIPQKNVLISFLFFSFFSQIVFSADSELSSRIVSPDYSFLDKLLILKDKAVEFAKSERAKKILKASPYIFGGLCLGVAGWKIRQHLTKILLGSGVGAVCYVAMASKNRSDLCKITRGLNDLTLFSDSEIRDLKVATWTPGKDRLFITRNASVKGTKEFYSPANIIADKDIVSAQLKGDLISGKIVEIPVVPAGQEDVVEKLLWISINEQSCREEEILNRKMKQVSSLTNADEILELFEDIDISQCDDLVLDQMKTMIEANCKSSGFRRLGNLWISKKDRLDCRIFGFNYAKASQVYYELFKRRLYLKSLQACIADKLSDSLGAKKLISIISK